MVEYYVTANGSRVEGPFETRAEAKRRADDLSTTEVLFSYGVEATR
ncbi:hypothetical protein [Natronorarus salvus]